jgi:hypothetical protein
MKIRKHQIHFFILLFAVSSLLFHSPLDYEANATDGWYNDSWDLRKKITASLDTVIDSDLTDFPYLVSVTDSDLTQAAESDGSDIVFTASDGTTELDYEMEKFDQSTGEIIAWVKIPTVFGSENTDIYMYYKGTSTSSSSPWDDNYNLVWHLNQDSDGTVDDFADSSGNENHGTSGGTGKQAHDDSRETSQVAGQIGHGQKFAGANIRSASSNAEGAGDYIWINEVGSWPTGDATIELWVGDITASPGAGANYNDQFSYCINASNDSTKENHWNIWRTKKVKMKVRTDFFVSSSKSVEGDNSASYTNWNHLVAVYNLNQNGQGASKLYINGEQAASSSRSASETYSIIGSGSAVLGGDIDGNSCNIVNNGYNGKMDEFRISNTLRSADWVAASYCNQSGSNECQTMGSEEPRPLTVTITTSNGTCGDTISSSAGSSVTFSYTTTFSTSTSDFTIGDITVSGGTVSNFDGSGTTYTFDVVVSESTTVTVSIAASVATNTAGGENSVSNTCTLTADIPVVTTSDTSTTGGTCSRHVILGNCGTITINNDEYRIIDTWTNVPTTEVLVGQPVTVTLSTPDNPTHTKIHFASVHTEVFSIPANFDQTAHIDYSPVNNQVTYVSQSQLFQVAGATHRITQDPDVKNLELFEVVFTMIFAKPMDTSHVVVETKNKHGIPETLYLMDALKVNENLPQALTLEEKSKFSIVDPEPEMDQEPPMEPDVKITCGKGTVLKDNLCAPKEWSFLDYFEHLMKMFG